MFFRQEKSPIDDFIGSLTYWQAYNLFIVLRMCLTSDSYDEAESKALLNSTDDEKLKELLEQAINSPRFPYNVKIDVNITRQDEKHKKSTKKK